MDLHLVWRLGWNQLIISERSNDSSNISDMEVSFSAVKTVANDLESISLSNETIVELKDLISKYKDVISEASKFKGKNEDISPELEKKLEEYVAEIKNNDSLWIDRVEIDLKKIKVRRLFTDTLINPVKLQNGASSFFTKTIWNKMNNLAKKDLEDGCLCILVEAWTPAAMIIMRSIESGLRIYYEKITTNDPATKNWGELIQELKENPAIDKNLLAYFNYLREFRNRLQHPDARFIQSETEDVLAQSIHIFHRIYN